MNKKRSWTNGLVLLKADSCVVVAFFIFVREELFKPNYVFLQLKCKHKFIGFWILKAQETGEKALYLSIKTWYFND